LRLPPKSWCIVAQTSVAPDAVRIVGGALRHLTLASPHRIDPVQPTDHRADTQLRWAGAIAGRHRRGQVHGRTIRVLILGIAAIATPDGVAIARIGIPTQLTTVARASRCKVLIRTATTQKGI